MKLTNVHKLYVSNFLTGLVFWYGIEKLFMQSIGIDAVGVGTITAVMIVFLVVFDIPSGILADRWSRKYMLMASAGALAASSFVLGISTGFWPYFVGILFYGLYVVATSGTYGAIMYDVLHEEKRATQYSKIQGVAYGLFLAGAGLGNIVGGFVADVTSYNTAYFISIASCLLNIVILATIEEPTFHKQQAKTRLLTHLKKALHVLLRYRLLQVLTIVSTLLAVAELFKLDFGQLYFMRYVDSPTLLGILWAIYAFAMAAGSFFAHRFHARLPVLIIGTSLPYLLMSVVDSGWSISLFILQAFVGAILLNQIETHIQQNTESVVRASVLSVVSTMGRVVTVPVSFFIGWLIVQYDVLWAVRFVAVVLLVMVLLWLGMNRRKNNV